MMFSEISFRQISLKPNKSKGKGFGGKKNSLYSSNFVFSINTKPFLRKWTSHGWKGKFQGMVSLIQTRNLLRYKVPLITDTVRNWLILILSF